MSCEHIAAGETSQADLAGVGLGDGLDVGVLLAPVHRGHVFGQTMLQTEHLSANWTYESQVGARGHFFNYWRHCQIVSAGYRLLRSRRRYVPPNDWHGEIARTVQKTHRNHHQWIALGPGDGQVEGHLLTLVHYHVLQINGHVWIMVIHWHVISYVDFRFVEAHVWNLDSRCWFWL